MQQEIRKIDRTSIVGEVPEKPLIGDVAVGAFILGVGAVIASAFPLSIGAWVLAAIFVSLGSLFALEPHRSRKRYARWRESILQPAGFVQLEDEVKRLEALGVRIPSLPDPPLEGWVNGGVSAWIEEANRSVAKHNEALIAEGQKGAIAALQARMGKAIGGER